MCEAHATIPLLVYWWINIFLFRLGPYNIISHLNSNIIISQIIIYCYYYDYDGSTQRARLNRHVYKVQTISKRKVTHSYFVQNKITKRKIQKKVQFKTPT